MRFDNLIDVETGEILEIDFPEANDNLKALMQQEGIKERAAEFGARVRDTLGSRSDIDTSQSTESEKAS